MLPLELLFFTIILSTCPSLFALDFLYNSFTANTAGGAPTLLKLTKDSRLVPPVIRLTNGSKQFSLGRAFYPSPVPFKPTNNPNSSNISTSFSTQFVFSVLPDVSTSPGFGLAFVLSASTSLPNALAGQYFGLFPRAINNGPAPLLAVEFDTGRNPEFNDPNGNHVGIDLNSIQSIQIETAGYYTLSNSTANASFVPFDMRNGQNIHAWIEFSGPRYEMNVTIAPFGVPRPKRPLLTFRNPAIANYVSTEMYVGFSASKTTWVEAQRVLAWSFSDTGVARDINTTNLPVFQLANSSCGLSAGATAGIVIGCVLAVGIRLGLLYWFLWRSGVEDDKVEDWELEYWPHRFSYEELFQATNGFSKEELLGSGGFERVYKGVLANNSEVAVKCVNHDSKQGLREFMADNSSSTNTTGQNNRGLSNGVLVFDDSSFDSDLSAIPFPDKAVYPQIQAPPPPARLQPTSSPQPPMVQPPSQRLKPNSQMGDWGIPNDPVTPTSRPLDSSRTVVLVDSQENGIKLVHTLMACAEAIQQENMKVAEALVKQIGYLAVSQAGAMRKVATYFAEALTRRIYRLYPTNPYDSAFTDMLQMHFYETCPYLKFAHFTANQAILEAFADKSRVHVIDFSMKQGMQWPALLQALALRPGGPPSFRLTGIGPPSHDNTDDLQVVGWKLAELAENINVQFEYRGFVANSLADLDASMFDIREGETVAVNSISELHQLLARPGAIDKVLSVVRELKPEILTIVEQEANHNGPVFLDRFTESLHYYSTLFDSLEGCGNSSTGGSGGGDSVASGGGSVTDQDKMMSEVYLGRQICNVVACEGVDRVERHETLTQWKTRLNSAGFEPIHLGSNAFEQASMLLALFAAGDGYRVEENNGCLMLGWHTRPLIATSAWKLG